MKTPDEIKKDAETCMNHPYMDTCNSCRLYKECHGISDHIVKELYDLVLHYESRLAQAERERDAARHDLMLMGISADREYLCEFCEPDSPLRCEYCRSRPEEAFLWRGVCKQNTKGESECR